LLFNSYAREGGNARYTLCYIGQTCRYFALKFGSLKQVLFFYEVLAGTS